MPEMRVAGEEDRHVPPPFSRRWHGRKYVSPRSGDHGRAERRA
jgi:hypothetical protein